MANTYIYKPNSILIPDSAPIRKYYPECNKIPLEGRHRLDFRTIFYDVFFDTSTNRLIGIGPDLKKFSKNLFPMKVRVNSQNLRYNSQQIKGIFIFQTEEIEVSKDLPLEVIFEFNSFFQKLSPLKLDNEINFYDKTRHRLTLSTLQKDNLVPWISDWMIWHHHRYGVKRLVLYDNGSHNQDALIEYLRDFDIDMDIVFIHWDFPHGFDPYKYCQRGALNHCRLRFPVSDSYCINLDIDEYLISSVDNLVDYLDTKLRYPRPGSLAIQQVIIPNVAPENTSSTVRCWNFKHRHVTPGYKGEAKIWNEYGRSKYIYSFDNVGFNAVHSTDSFKNRKFRKRYSLFSIVVVEWKKFVWEITKKIFRFRHPKPRIDTLYPELSEFCFFHFWGLDNGWRTGGIPKLPQDIHQEKHTVETRISEIELVVKSTKSYVRE